jgi:hypothetical protein
MPSKPGDRTRLPESGLLPEHALIAALLRQALADRHDRHPVVRQEALAWFAAGTYQYWLSLVGLKETALDPALKGRYR